MPHSKKYILILSILVVLAALSLSLSFKSNKNDFASRQSFAHFYKDSGRKIGTIYLKVFYAVPKNKSPREDWREFISPVLEDSAKFHKVQFREMSSLNYDIFPEPLILENEAIFYDTENTDKGNPEGLKNIIKEIEKRKPEFLKTESVASQAEFPAIVIIYEGVGASGTDGAMILSRTFLTDSQYQPFRSSLFYHEFGHTIGLPDLYDISHNTPFSNDIMGSGRRKPIDQTYIGRELLKEMGVIR